LRGFKGFAEAERCEKPEAAATVGDGFAASGVGSAFPIERRVN